MDLDGALQTRRYSRARLKNEPDPQEEFPVFKEGEMTAFEADMSSKG